jgi:hypothetical protein
LKRLKGLEPSTFCMASRRSSQLSYSRIFDRHYTAVDVQRARRRRPHRTLVAACPSAPRAGVQERIAHPVAPGDLLDSLKEHGFSAEVE